MSLAENAKPVEMKNVSVKDNFWSKRTELIRDVVIPYQWEALNDRIPGAAPSHAIMNFKIAAGMEKGEFYGMVFQDSDVGKWLEAVAYSLETTPNVELEKTADEVIDIIEKAQQADGYLNTYFILKEPGKRWTNLIECHELYCAGHLIEAAVAYFKATGKRKFLDVMSRYADNIDTVFGTEEGKIRGYDGHEEIELALVKLYKATGNDKYLKLAKYFIDERGQEPYFFDIEKERNGKEHFKGMRGLGRKYFQSHIPVREQESAEGHSVRAMYLFTGMADIAGATSDTELLDACRKLWDNLVQKRMYITAGIGSTHVGEAFTFDYDLPNDTAYAETCASIGLVFFAHRMLQIDTRSCYADVLERALYNTVISGMSLDGKSFFYVNPLEVNPEASEKDPGKYHVMPTRQKWFGCACCPPNLARLLTSLGEYIYSAKEDTIYQHLYIGSEVNINLQGSKVKLTEETNYPWDSKVKITVCADSKKFKIALRIPGWCRSACVSVNGVLTNISAKMENGYAVLERVWNNGDIIELDFPMPVMKIRSNPLLSENAGKVAIQRGPIVYCIEEADNGKHLSEVFLPKDSAFENSHIEVLDGITVIDTNAFRLEHESWGEELYRQDELPKFKKQKVRLIPYYAWANRDIGEMSVWIREM